MYHILGHVSGFGCIFGSYLGYILGLLKGGRYSHAFQILVENCTTFSVMLFCAFSVKFVVRKRCRGPGGPESGKIDDFGVVEGGYSVNRYMDLRADVKMVKNGRFQQGGPF